MTTNVINTKIREVENKIPDTSGLVKKTDYNAKISDIEKKYFITNDYNNFKSEIIDAKITEKGLVDKSNISSLINNSSYYAGNCKNDFLVLGEGPTDYSNDSIDAAEKFSINFSKAKTKFCLSMCYNHDNSYLFVNGKEIYV